MVFNFFEDWAEFFFFVLLVVGFIIALLTTSAVISYIVIFISGMTGGRFVYLKKRKLSFPYYLIAIGFLIGYMMGAYYGNRSVMLTLFVLGAFVSYFVYERGILHDIRY